MDCFAQLKRTRENRKLALSQVANALKISEIYLRAIEEQDYSKLPEFVYAAGFIRSYANYLDINSDDLIRQFKKDVFFSKEESAVIEISSYKRGWLKKMLSFMK